MLKSETHWRCTRADNDRIHVIQIEDRIYEIIANSREVAVEIAKQADQR